MSTIKNASAEQTDQTSFDDEIDLRELFLTLWQRRLFITSIGLIGALLSGLFAFSLPKIFESSVLLIPTETPKADDLGAAAALLGGKKGGSSDDLDLYQGLLTSRTAIHKLLKTSFVDHSDTGKERTLPLFELLGLDTGKKVQYFYSVEGLAKSISVKPLGTGEGGILQVTAQAPTPWLAQEIADSIVSLGQAEIRKVRAERMETVLPLLEGAANEAKSEWDNSTQSIAVYRDKNRSITMPEQQMTLDRLNMERQVLEQKYLMARHEVEQQELDKEKAVPPTMVLDSAELPVIKSKPKRSLYLAGGTLMFLMLACIWVLVIKFLKPVQHPEPD